MCVVRRSLSVVRCAMFVVGSLVLIGCYAPLFVVVCGLVRRSLLAFCFVFSLRCSLSGAGVYWCCLQVSVAVDCCSRVALRRSMSLCVVRCWLSVARCSVCVGCCLSWSLCAVVCRCLLFCVLLVAGVVLVYVACCLVLVLIGAECRCLLLLIVVCWTLFVICCCFGG